MQIKFGYRIEAICQAPTPMIAMLDVYPSSQPDLVRPARMQATALAGGAELSGLHAYRDQFGNQCQRFVAPAGGVLLSAEGTMHHSGLPDETHPGAQAVSPQDLPDDVLVFVLGSRYCETDRLSDFAWSQFGMIAGGWSKVQAVCDFVHHHIRFDYALARNTRSAAEGFAERVGVCRDFAHLAITLCRCLNIPARYCTGYLGDIGVPLDPNPMDFSAWFEAFLDGRWWTFDARHNVPRIGRIVMARGRDATDVPILNSFGTHVLQRFDVVTLETPAPANIESPEARRDHWNKSLLKLHGEQAA